MSEPGNTKPRRLASATILSIVAMRSFTSCVMNWLLHTGGDTLERVVVAVAERHGPVREPGQVVRLEVPEVVVRVDDPHDRQAASPA